LSEAHGLVIGTGILAPAGLINELQTCCPQK
jgi:hypothetical protein